MRKVEKKIHCPKCAKKHNNSTIKCSCGHIFLIRTWRTGQKSKNNGLPPKPVTEINPEQEYKLCNFGHKNPINANYCMCCAHPFEISEETKQAIYNAFMAGKNVPVIAKELSLSEPCVEKHLKKQLGIPCAKLRKVVRKSNLKGFLSKQTINFLYDLGISTPELLIEKFKTAGWMDEIKCTRGLKLAILRDLILFERRYIGG